MESSCKKCGNSKIVKNGKSRNGEQRYLCKQCNYSFQLVFHYKSYRITDFEIIQLTKEGCGIRSTARILGISPKLLEKVVLIKENLILNIEKRVLRGTIQKECKNYIQNVKGQEVEKTQTIIHIHY